MCNYVTTKFFSLTEKVPQPLKPVTPNGPTSYIVHHMYSHKSTIPLPRMKPSTYVSPAETTNQACRVILRKTKKLCHYQQYCKHYLKCYSRLC